MIIYFVAFDAKEQIVASNYPVTNLNLESLDDLVFWLAPCTAHKFVLFAP